MIRRGETKFPYKGNEQYFEKLFEEVEKFVEKTNSRKIKGEEK